ncbi:hypothetical protein [Maribacter sp. ACAM166]|uniref:hypothetical protein n=1 Tax=Maribacter sp. ACAM166 TaxID=2508996 RepID=UPI0010FD4A95|nr:hypothetical protein [Maribacter sp. ACAM166]TLP79178.1 hypothetical protein ES765_11360 [Maribacter sp. ACAM166]
MACLLLTSTHTNAQEPKLNLAKDILLVQFDSKTDVDDLHSIANFVTLLEYSNYSDLNYHVIAGAYGIQEGL